MHKAISSLSDTAIIDIYTIPFIARMTSNLCSTISSVMPETQSVHEKRLDVLKSWKLMQSSLGEAGVFTAIACNLKSQIERGYIAYHNLKKLGISADLSVSQIVGKLKGFVAAEWLGENSDEYQDFLIICPT